MVQFYHVILIFRKKKTLNPEYRSLFEIHPNSRVSFRILHTFSTVSGPTVWCFGFFFFFFLEVNFHVIMHCSVGPVHCLQDP